MSIKVLATDLDGTLIPLDGDAKNRADLVELAQLLREQEIALVFVTGRHFASAWNAIAEFDLPRPDWILCDVGSSAYQVTHMASPKLDTGYATHLEEVTRGVSLSHVESTIESALGHLNGFRLQEPEKQGRFKLSYYADGARLAHCQEQLESTLGTLGLPFSVIGSLDPFTGDGLLDILPNHVTKAYALQWWSEKNGFQRSEIAFSGDSGNDMAALTHGYASIVVGNAAPEVVDEVKAAHEQGRTGRLHISAHSATSGVLDGLRCFL